MRHRRVGPAGHCPLTVPATSSSTYWDPRFLDYMASHDVASNSIMTFHDKTTFENVC